MSSPMTIMITQARMYFVERTISKLVSRTYSLQSRYIDDQYIMSNVLVGTLEGREHFWNGFDNHTKFSDFIE